MFFTKSMLANIYLILNLICLSLCDPVQNDGIGYAATHSSTNKPAPSHQKTAKTTQHQQVTSKPISTEHNNTLLNELTKPSQYFFDKAINDLESSKLFGGQLQKLLNDLEKKIKTNYLKTKDSAIKSRMNTLSSNLKSVIELLYGLIEGLHNYRNGVGDTYSAYGKLKATTITLFKMQANNTKSGADYKNLVNSYTKEFITYKKDLASFVKNWEKPMTQYILDNNILALEESNAINELSAIIKSEKPGSDTYYNALDMLSSFHYAKDLTLELKRHVIDSQITINMLSNVEPVYGANHLNIKHVDLKETSENENI